MVGSGAAYHGNGGHNSHEAATLIILVNAYKQWYSFWLLKDSLFDHLYCSYRVEHKTVL
jgi:hypothetical protein